MGLTSALLVGAGLVSGYSWAGGSFTGVNPTGAGWGDLVGMSSLLVGLSILTGLVALLGQLAFCLVTFRTFTSGRAAAQEILALADDDQSADFGVSDDGDGERQG